MTILQAALLGALQGLTEFLPVSSSGHLLVAQSLLGLQDVPVLFDVLLHIATLVVVVFVFRERILSIISTLFRLRRLNGAEDRENVRLTLVVLLATVLTGVLGLWISNYETAFTPAMVGVFFLVTAAILIGSHFTHGTISYDRIGVRHGIVVGISQGLGVIPGISRSGITISASLATGLERRRAGEFSFLISIPAILGSLVLTLKDAGALSRAVPAGALVVGLISALVVGFVALGLLLRVVRGGRLYLFSLYLIPVGILTILFA